MPQVTPRSATGLFALPLALSIALAPAALAQATAPATGAPSIRAIDAAPFPSAMVGAPSGKLVAWVQNAEGARSIWVAAAPDYRARRVAVWEKDDGQDLSDLAFAADGRTLWFTRGGGPNRAGETPNPSSDPAGVEQAIWRVRLIEGAQPERVAEGSRSLPAPVGDGFVFVQRGQLMKLAESNGKVEATPLFRMRGSAGEARWSPDGRRLAVVSSRGTHAYVGVYDLAAGTLRWMAPSTDTDRSPVWSPDGTRIAFLREPYEAQRMMFVPQRTAQPWSIYVADAATGRARELFSAAAGRGSAFWNVVSASQVMWTADDRIVFPWERDGFVHLYCVPAAGGAWTQLDKGAHEVEYVALAPDRRHVVFNSNQGDRDRRHLWRVPADGSRPAEALTPGEGIEWAPVPLADGAVAHLRSDARMPAHAAIIAGGGGGARRALAPETLPQGYPADRLVAPTAVTITASDGVQSYGQLFLPPAGTGTVKRPAIIFLHGGSRRQMLLGWNYGAYYHHAYAFNQALALRGWVVLSLNYRSGIGYGRDFREALDYGAAGNSEYRDVVAAARMLRARAEVDTARIALWGGSYGGYLTANGLARNPELFAGGVDIHGVHDWNVGIRTFLPDYNPLEDPAAAKLAFMSSPRSAVKGWRDPVLLIHGDDDRNVRFIETLTLIEKLRKQKVHVEQLVLPDEVHFFLRHTSWMTAFETSLDFLEREVVKKGREDAKPLRAELR
jgi:dipeptidyl aminopeptidase/acylaminoacyl peptidase